MGFAIDAAAIAPVVADVATIVMDVAAATKAVVRVELMLQWRLVFMLRASSAVVVSPIECPIESDDSPKGHLCKIF